MRGLAQFVRFAQRGLKNHVSPVRFRPSAQAKSLGNSALASATPSAVTMSLGRRSLFKMIGATAATVALAPLAHLAPRWPKFVVDPRAPANTLYWLDSRYAEAVYTPKYLYGVITLGDSARDFAYEPYDATLTYIDL